MKQRDGLVLVGSILVGVGVFMFLKSVQSSAWGFYRLGRISTGGILIALILVDVILLTATRHKAAKIALPILITMLILSLILGTHLYFSASALDLLLMLGPAAVGAGLLLRAFLLKKKD